MADAVSSSTYVADDDDDSNNEASIPKPQNGAGAVFREAAPVLPLTPEELEIMAAFGAPIDIERIRLAKKLNENDRLITSYTHTSGLSVCQGVAMCVPYKVVTLENRKAEAQTVIDSVMRAVDSVLNNWNSDSELCQVLAIEGKLAKKRHLDGPDPCGDVGSVVSPLLSSVLLLTNKLHEITSGRFDPTVGPLIRLWDSNLKKGSVPSHDEIKATQAITGWKSVTIVPVENRDLNRADVMKSVSEEGDGTYPCVRLSVACEGIEIDLCGITKGYAVDMIVQGLCEVGIKDALVEWGGDIRCVGKHPVDKRPWRCGLIEPPSLQELYSTWKTGKQRYPNRWLGKVDTIDAALTTSGDYSQPKRLGYYSTIDITTGRMMQASKTSVASVSIMSRSAAVADAIATAAVTLPTESSVRDWLEYVAGGWSGSIMGFWIYTRESGRVLFSYNVSNAPQRPLVSPFDRGMGLCLQQSPTKSECNADIFLKHLNSCALPVPVGVVTIDGHEGELLVTTAIHICSVSPPMLSIGLSQSVHPTQSWSRWSHAMKALRASPASDRGQRLKLRVQILGNLTALDTESLCGSVDGSTNAGAGAGLDCADKTFVVDAIRRLSVAGGRGDGDAPLKVPLFADMECTLVSMHENIGNNKQDSTNSAGATVLILVVEENETTSNNSRYELPPPSLPLMTTMGLRNRADIKFISKLTDPSTVVVNRDTETKTAVERVWTMPQCVCIITTVDDAGNPWGAALSSVAIVSISAPCQVMFNLQRITRLHALLSQTQRARATFAVHFLTSEHEHIAKHFSVQNPSSDLLFRSSALNQGDDWMFHWSYGVPILRNASQLILVCQAQQVIEAGDHSVVVASVLESLLPPTHTCTKISTNTVDEQEQSLVRHPSHVNIHVDDDRMTMRVANIADLGVYPQRRLTNIVGKPVVGTTGRAQPTPSRDETGAVVDKADFSCPLLYWNRTYVTCDLFDM